MSSGQGLRQAGGLMLLGVNNKDGESMVYVMGR